MTLLDTSDLRMLVSTGLDDFDLETIIAREEAELVRRYGVHGDGSTPISETVAGGTRNVYLSRPIASISSIVEATTLGGSTTTLAATSYYAWLGEGRITRLPEGTCWGPSVVVSYVPQDDRERRRQVLIELCRLTLSQGSMRRETQKDNGAEYTYEAPDWEQARRKQYRRLEYPGL